MGGQCECKGSKSAVGRASVYTSMMVQVYHASVKSASELRNCEVKVADAPGSAAA